MTVTWSEAALPGWAPLVGALAPLLEPALARLPRRPELPLVVRPGRATGPTYEVVPGTIALHPALADDALHALEDAALLDTAAAALALDRWRRALGCVLEGVARSALAEHGAPLDGSLTIGRAALSVDAAEPALGWLWPEAAGLAMAPDIGLHDAPRRAAWWLRWCALNQHPEALSDARAWVRFGQWCRDLGHGPLADCPAPIPLAGPTEGPLPALSHRLLARDGGPRGRALRDGPGHALLPNVVAPDQRGQLLLGALHADPNPVEDEPGPVGSWRLRSGAVGGRIGAARGVFLELHPGGRVELTMADGFLGLPTGPMLEMAEQWGVSGMTMGRWRNEALEPDGRGGRLGLSGLNPAGFSLHGRQGASFAMPGGDWLAPLQRAIAGLQTAGLRWRLEPDGGLHTEAALPGYVLELRFGREP